MTFGEKIQKLRKDAGLPQEELSYQLGVSRQAISKWERDSGYPETEKIIHMSKIFNVTLDYMLTEEDTVKQALCKDETGFYVSRETANGFLLHQKNKMKKIGIAIGVCVAGIAFTFVQSDVGILFSMIAWIIGIVLLFAVKLTDNPYSQIWTEQLSFDNEAKKELNSKYADRKKRSYILSLIGVALISVGFLLLPLLVPTQFSMLDNLMLAIGWILAGIGAFFCIYGMGMTHTYRILLKN